MSFLFLVLSNYLMLEIFCSYTKCATNSDITCFLSKIRVLASHLPFKGLFWLILSLAHFKSSLYHTTFTKQKCLFNNEKSLNSIWLFTKTILTLSVLLNFNLTPLKIQNKCSKFPEFFRCYVYPVTLFCQTALSSCLYV